VPFNYSSSHGRDELDALVCRCSLCTLLKEKVSVPFPRITRRFWISWRSVYRPPTDADGRM
jgi:hypothetical protein